MLKFIDYSPALQYLLAFAYTPMAVVTDNNLPM